MKYLQKFLKDRRGVTPVVGVILMVAITVVMGAVVAGFVYGYVGTTERGPLVSLSVVDNPGDHESFVIKHNGGELIVDSDWKLSVTENKSSATIFSVASLAVTNGIFQNVDNADISTGRVLIVANQTGGTEDDPVAGAAVAVGDWYHVVIVHVPSSSLLLDTNVQVR